MDDAIATRWITLVRQFGLQKTGADPWDAPTLDVQSSGASHGEKFVIQFLLRVWDPGHEWSCGKFDVLEALSVWDEQTRAAFLNWAQDPWWP